MKWPVSDIWKKSPRLRTYATLVLVWFGSMMLVWGLVENPLYDFASFMHCAERWAGGEVVYQDFQWMYPPLSIWLYGGVIRYVSSSYYATASLSALLSLLILTANYSVARLLFPRTRSVALAVAAYCACFTATSASGVNVLTMGFSFSGIALFSWFVAGIGHFLKRRRPLPHMELLLGCLGGVAVLNKHEQIVGVAAVFVFLLLRRTLLGKKDLNLMTLGFPVVVIAFLGYGYTGISSGWGNLMSALTAYGTAAEHASRNMPSLAIFWKQSLLLLLHLSVVLFVWERASRDISRVRMHVSIVFMLTAIALLAAEGLRALYLAMQIDGSSDRAITSSAALLGMVSRGGGTIQATIHYIGELLLNNVVPMLLCLIVLSITWYRLFARTRKDKGYHSGIHLQTTGLCLAAAWGLQIRGLLAYSDPGTFGFLFPTLLSLVVFALPRGYSKILFRKWYAYALLAMVGIAALLIYVYEFRAARILPIRVHTDKGIVGIPSSPEHRAFAALCDKVRSMDPHYVVAVPNQGIQYWTGGKTPFSWLAHMTPALYHPPWSTNLVDKLQSEKDMLFVVFEQSESFSLYLPEPEVNWLDGPMYRPYRWKEAFPELWNHITSNTQEIAVFEENGTVYFRLYGPLTDTTSSDAATASPAAQPGEASRPSTSPSLLAR